METRRYFSFVECEHCHKQFEKRNAEIKRSNKKGMKHFCKRSCSVSYGNIISPRYCPKNLISREIDELSPFRCFMLRVRRRSLDCDQTSPKAIFDVDVNYLKEIWEKQNGICPYTGWYLILPKSTYGFKEESTHNASLDRIDCNKGYIKGNVQFVSVMANYAKNCFEDSKLLEFCESVVQYQSIKSLAV